MIWYQTMIFILKAVVLRGIKNFFEGPVMKEWDCVTLAGSGRSVVLTHHREDKADMSTKSVTPNVLFICFSFDLKVKY